MRNLLFIDCGRELVPQPGVDRARRVSASTLTLLPLMSVGSRRDRRSMIAVCVGSPVADRAAQAVLEVDGLGECSPASRSSRGSGR